MNNQIVTFGSYAPGGHNAARVISVNGITPTIMENHGTVVAILVIESDNNEK